jgi:hypothetical protein
MELIISWLVIPLFILFITGPVAAHIFVALFEKGQRRGLGLFWLGLSVITFLLGLFIAYTFGDFFPGPGCFISVFTPLMVIFTLLFVRFRAKRVYQALGNDKVRRRWFNAGTLLIPFLQLAAPVISFGYIQTCNVMNRQVAKPLIVALEQYKTDTGSYLPADNLDRSYQRDLQFLAPDYLPTIPPRACGISFFNSPDSGSQVGDDWSLYNCTADPSSNVLLMVPTIGSDSEQIYNLTTGYWSGRNSFDGYCNYLD